MQKPSPTRSRSGYADKKLATKTASSPVRSGVSTSANQHSVANTTTNKTPALAPRKYSSPNPVPLVVPRDTKPTEGAWNKPTDSSMDLLTLPSFLGLLLVELRSFARWMINFQSSFVVSLRH